MHNSLEMSCHANECRSKLAEAIAKDYIEKHKLDVTISSSGVYVDAIRQRKVPFAFMVAMAEQGLQKDIYSPQEIQTMEKAITEKDLPTLGKYVQKTVNLLVPEERAHRDYFAKKEGLTLSSGKQQTIVRPKTTAIICMDNLTKEEATNIYATENRKISIDVVGKYINALSAEIPTTTRLTKKEFEHVFERIKTYVPQTIETILNNTTK